MFLPLRLWLLFGTLNQEMRELKLIMPAVAHRITWQRCFLTGIPNTMWGDWSTSLGFPNRKHFLFIGRHEMLAPVGFSFELVGLGKNKHLQKDRDKQKESRTLVPTLTVSYWLRLTTAGKQMHASERILPGTLYALILKACHRRKPISLRNGASAMTC
jgi:hypothetical protein